jgi:hypothetical protein
MLRLAAIDEAANRLTYDIVDPGLSTGADGDELFLLRHGSTAQANQECQNGDAAHDLLHFHSP